LVVLSQVITVNHLKASSHHIITSRNQGNRITISVADNWEQTIQVVVRVCSFGVTEIKLVAAAEFISASVPAYLAWVAGVGQHCSCWLWVAVPHRWLSCVISAGYVNHLVSLWRSRCESLQYYAFTTAIMFCWPAPPPQSIKACCAMYR
jgi:hypothetical protein